MKTSILANKNIQKILSVLFEQPRRFFSITELSHRTGAGAGRISMLLPILIKRGIVNSLQKKQRRYFQINSRSGFFSELEDLYKQKKAKARKPDLIHKVIAPSGELQFVVLSGIFTGLVNAPVDVLIVGRISSRKLEKSIARLEEIMENEINYAAMSKDEYLERLYSYDWFIKEIMERDPIVLVDKIKDVAIMYPEKKHLKAVFSNIKK